MFDKLILPLQILITGFAYIISVFVKSLLWLHKPTKMISIWFKIKILWKLNAIHVKLKKEK